MISSVLIKPERAQLDAYVEALRQGWSPDNLRPEVAQEQLARIDEDAEAFLAGFDDLEGEGPPVTLPDGSSVPRLPSLRRWIWRDGFCGSIGLRWQKGTDDLPPTCLGHSGYAVVPWRRGEGLASAALIELLPIAKRVGLGRIELTTDPDNAASQRVIENAGGVFVRSMNKPDTLGGGEALLYQITLAEGRL